jgi:predicted short-subunit dehydrogenase-like oxidoreductase (DUF2520 family)
MRGAKPVLTFIGGGRVGSTLGYLFRRRGYTIQTIACSSEESAHASADFVGEGKPVRFPGAEVRPTGVVVLSVPDDRIAEVASGLGSQGADWSGCVALHCSGLLPAGVLGPLGELGASLGSMHPLQAFSTPERAVGLVEGTYFCLEGEEEAVGAARRLVLDLGGRPVIIPSDGKTLYHAAAALAANGAVACFALALHLMIEAGMDGDSARRSLAPLLLGSARNLAEAGPKGAITGPVARGDVETVRAHMEALRELPDEVVAETYASLSRVLMDVAQQVGHLGPVQANQIRKLLDKKKKR